MGKFKPRHGPRRHETHRESAKKRKRSHIDVETLDKAVEELDPKTGNYADFANLPLSEPTQAGLESAHFTSMTDIQAKAIPLALKGHDILGAAKTGSGKTLAFLIPVLENLYRKQFVGPDVGLGAMIISPTRELAIQIFEVLRTVGGKGHMFAAGLIIGGKSLQEEQDALVRMNIVVCTPGRMLQHLSQTVAFNVDGLQMLVLDEADRILDMGFQRDVDAILQYLPQERQTMLFSATQTKRVSDLARLSLKEPEYVSVHQEAATATPKSLQQNYVVTPLPEKLDTLWSFLQSAKKDKVLVFLSSTKQVRFVYESFRQMQPGIPLLHLHGKQKQGARLEISKRFTSAKNSCLFATDVAARGLDFPAVDWVVQVDCPEDADTYIHRVGRTARYEREGRAILFLDPSEEPGMLKRLEAKKVPIELVNIRGNKKTSIRTSLQNMCFKDAQLKYVGQKAFASYVRSIYVQHDKEVFQLEKLDLEEFAASLGLPGAPKIRFLQGDNPKARKNAPRVVLSDSDEEDDSDNELKDKSKKQMRTKYDRMFERRNQDILADHYNDLVNPNGDFGGENANGDDFMTVKRRIPVDSESDASENDDSHRKFVRVNGINEPILVDSNRAEKRLTSKKKMLKYREKSHKLVFDDEGNARPVYELEDEEEFRRRGLPTEQRQKFINQEMERVALQDQEDKQRVKQRRKEKMVKRKMREREEDDGTAAGPYVGSDDETAGRDLVQDFIDDNKSVSDDEGSDQEPQSKRNKKWFEEEPKNKKKGKFRQADAEPLLEDLESMALGLLDV